MKILIPHGPNFNVIGRCELQTYGWRTLVQINERLATPEAATWSVK